MLAKPAATIGAALKQRAIQNADQWLVNGHEQSIATTTAASKPPPPCGSPTIDPNPESDRQHQWQQTASRKIIMS
jgi:hypothetical protein